MDAAWTHSFGVSLRTPLLPFATLERLTCADLDDLRAKVREAVADPQVRAAIALSSPDLDAALDRGGEGTLHALLGYVARMAGRPTPFGLSAGCTGGDVEGEPAYDLAGRAALRTRARADVAFAVPGEVVRPNPTAFVTGERLRYVEREAGRFHQAVVEHDETVAAVLDLACDGTTAEALAQSLAGDGVTVEEARAYVADLQDAQVLLRDLVLPERATAVSVDSSRPATRLVLGDAVLREAVRAVEVLHPLGRPGAIDRDLAAFRAAFAQRWGDAEVPLLHALDPEVGVGFGPPAALAAAGAPLLTGFRAQRPTEGEPWTPIDHHLVDLLSRALRTGAQELVLDASDLGPLRTPDQAPLPDALAVLATVAARDAAAVRDGDFRLVVHEVAGPGGAGLLSRFGDLDERLGALLRDHTRAEEALRPDAVLAEVAHLPDGRAANAAARPRLRARAIPLLGLDDGAERVEPGDLRVSVSGGRIVLRSHRLGRAVLPRLTAAHDYRTSPLPLYRFLGAVAHEGTAGLLRWSWGQVQSAPFLPRVVTGRLVLARAQWRWFRADLREVETAATPQARYDAVQRLRDEWRVARWVGLARGTNEIPLDLDGIGAAELLAREARRYGQVTLRECLPGPEELCVTSPDGRLTHEFVLPLVRSAVAPVRLGTPRTPPPARLPEGGEWQSVRVACGPATADTVLRAVARDLLWFERHEGFLRLRLRDPAVLAAFVDGGEVADVTVETYRPGRVPEEALRADSAAALRLIGGDGGQRWRAAFHGVVRLLADTGLDAGAVVPWRDGLAARLGENGVRARRWAGRVHRRERPALRAPEPFVATVLDERSAALARVPALGDVAEDLCALHVARVLRAAHDVQRLVLYDLVVRAR